MFTNNKYKSCNQKEDLETRTDIHYTVLKHFNPFTTKNETFDDFRETSTACSSWYAEFRTFRIFEISLSIPKICEMIVFRGF